MKKIFTSFIMLCLLFVASFTASAQAELDKTFPLPAGQDVSFTAPQTGTLTATMNPGLYTLWGIKNILFTSKGGNNPVPMTIVNEANSHANVVSWEVIENQTYYFYADLMTPNQEEITLTMGEVTIEKPVCQVPMGERFLVKVGEAQKYATEEEGVLTASLSPGFNNTTAAAYMLYTSEDGNENSGIYQEFNTASGNLVTSISWEVKPNVQYYLMGTSTTGDQNLTLSFKANEEEDDARIPLSWNTTTPINPGKIYSITGTGTPAHIVTNKTEDYSIGSQLGLYDAAGQQITLTPVVADDNNYYYNIENLENGVKYTLECFTRVSLEISFEEGLYESSYVAAPKEISTGNLSLDAKTVYFYIPGADGKAVITTEQCPFNSVPTNLIFVDPQHTTPLQGVEASEDASGNYTCTFPVSEGESYYIYFESPNYIVANLAWKSLVEEPEYMTQIPTPVYDAEISTLYIYWNESISAIDDSTALVGTLTTPGEVDVTITFEIGTYDPSASGLSNNALYVNLSGTVETYGAGTYIVSFESIVQNENEEWNSPVNDASFIVETTAVSSLGVEAGVDAIYNLQGVKVSKPSKGGVYIINGKKVVLK